MSAFLFIATVIAVIFAGDAALRLWRQNKWKWRSWNDDDDDDGSVMS